MKIGIIIGSVRQGRMSDRLAKWVLHQAQELENVEAEIIDLMDYPMPLFDEPGSPRYSPNRQLHPAVKEWLNKLAEFDGYVLVTPEYNRSTPAVVKNAIDYIDFQIDKKPVALVAHGSSGGAQAIAHLRGIIPGVGAITVPQALFFTHRVGETISEAGELDEELKSKPHGPQTNLKAQLESLVWYSDALAKAHQQS